MVLFENIVIGQFVEVKHEGYLLFGTVRYKGHLNGVNGKWVGIELEYPFGNHNGSWRGRSYFRSKSKHGLFTHASNVRLHQKSQRSRNTYHKVSDCSSVDHSLFLNSSANLTDCYSISSDYAHQAKSGFENVENESSFCKAERYTLNHSIGRIVPAATMLKEGCSQNRVNPYFYYCTDEEFCPRPTIPHYTIPHEALKRQIKRGKWEDYGLHRPRFLTV